MTSRIRQIAYVVFIVFNWAHLNKGGWTKAVQGSKKKNKHFGLAINEPAVVYRVQVCRRISSLRIMKREDVGCGYTNQTIQGYRE
jgi:hypothetical protein